MDTVSATLSFQMPEYRNRKRLWRSHGVTPNYQRIPSLFHCSKQCPHPRRLIKTKVKAKAILSLAAMLGWDHPHHPKQHQHGGGRKRATLLELAPSVFSLPVGQHLTLPCTYQPREMRCPCSFPYMYTTNQQAWQRCVHPPAKLMSSRQEEVPWQ